MQTIRWGLLAALLLGACGPATEDDFVARMAREHRDDSPETGAADREAPATWRARRRPAARPCW
jgi:hypothetical protein